VASALNHPISLRFTISPTIPESIFSITSKGLPLTEALDYAVQIASALAAAAHATDIVYRDIKPGNAVVTAEGQVKVLDFGLAKLMERPARGPGRRDPENDTRDPE
jgi:eukaryotic-like serine/threonine-protein kinase